MGVSIAFHGYFKELKRVFQGRFKSVSRRFKVCFESVTRVFEECFTCVSLLFQLSRVFSGCFGDASWAILEWFKEVLS